MSNATGKRTYFDRKSYLLLIAVGTLILFVFFLFFVYLFSPAIVLIPTKLPDQLQSASIIANAIATPPVPVPSGLNFFYPWQSLSSAVFALIAVLIGAWALMIQAEESRNAVRSQIDASAQADTDRYNRENTVREEKIKQERKQIAGAISAEIRSWLIRFGKADFLASFQSRLGSSRNGVPTTMPLVPIFVERFPVFESISQKLGIFEGTVPSDIVMTYNALQGVLDAFKSIRSGDYEFLNNVLDGNSEEAVQKGKRAAERAGYGIEPIIQDLETLDGIGRRLVGELDRIHGNTLGTVPPWSKTG